MTESNFADTGVLVGPRGDEIRYYRHQGGNQVELVEMPQFDYTPDLLYARMVMALYHNNGQFGLAANLHWAKPTVPVMSLWFEGRTLAVNIYQVWKECRDGALAMGLPDSRVVLVGAWRKAPVAVWTGSKAKGMMAGVRAYLDQNSEYSAKCERLLDYSIPEKAKKPKWGYSPRELPPDEQPFNLARIAFGTAMEVGWYCVHGETGNLRLGSFL